MLTLAVLIVGTLSVFNNKKSEYINNTKLNIQKINTQSNMHVNYNKENIKSYNDIKNLKSGAGFDFKLPDYMIDGNKPVAYRIRKISDSCNAVQIAFDRKNNNKTSISIFMFKGEPKECIKGINKTRLNINSSVKLGINEETMKLDNIEGKNIALTTIDSQNKNMEHISKYFVWQDEEVYYAIEYCDIMNIEDVTIGDSISDDEVCKLANSFKKAEDIRNIDYTIIQ